MYFDPRVTHGACLQPVGAVSPNYCEGGQGLHFGAFRLYSYVVCVYPPLAQGVGGGVWSWAGSVHT